MTTNRFSGLVFVTSSYDAMAMYRVDGVSGLNVLTGIKSKVFPRHSLEWRGHQSCSQSGNQLSVPPIIMLSAPPFGRNGGQRLAKTMPSATSFFKKFGGPAKQAKEWRYAKYATVRYAPPSLRSRDWVQNI